LPAVVFDFGLWVLDGLVPFFQSLQLTPNMMSLLSLPTAVCAAMLVASGHFGFAGPVLLLAFGLDACDGALARKLGTASDAGEVVDATLDRYNDVIVMLGFLYYFRGELVFWLLGSAALIGTVAVSYIRAKGASFGIDANIGFMQRHERALWLGVATTTAPAIASFLEQPSNHPSYYTVVVALAAVALGTNITAMRRARLVVATLASRQRTSTRANEPTWSTAAP
jgi:CDP-diacylglycerol--glycerol-3-phosphate 3-phosphatidyltransferase